MSAPGDTKTSWSMAAAIGAALAASACCAIPLLLISLGLGGAWIGTLTALEPFRPIFIAVAVGALAFAGYREWKMSHQVDCDCETNLPSALRRTLLAIGVLAIAGLIASPWIIGDAASVETADIRAARETAVQEVALERAVLQVEGMTCASCNVTVRKALTNLDGVQDATVTFEPPQAFVTYDPARVTTDQLTEATSNVGYPSQIKRIR